MTKTSVAKKLKTKPLVFSRALGEEIVRRYSGGETIKDICADPDMPARSTVYFWLVADNDSRPAELIEWQSNMAKARIAFAFALADDTIDIADDTSNDTITKTGKDGSEYEVPNSEWISRSKLRVDTRLKLIEKIAPEQFGNALMLTGANGGPIRVEENPKDTARRLAFALALGAKAAARGDDEQSE